MFCTQGKFNCSPQSLVLEANESHDCCLLCCWHTGEEVWDSLSVRRSRRCRLVSEAGSQAFLFPCNATEEANYSTGPEFTLDHSKISLSKFSEIQ